MRGGRAAFLRDHGNRALGQRRVAVYHEHLGAGAGEQDGGRAAVADAVARGAAAGDDGDLAVEPAVVLARFLGGAHDRSSLGPGTGLMLRPHAPAGIGASMPLSPRGRTPPLPPAQCSYLRAWWTGGWVPACAGMTSLRRRPQPMRRAGWRDRVRHVLWVAGERAAADHGELDAAVERIAGIVPACPDDVLARAHTPGGQPRARARPLRPAGACGWPRRAAWKADR